MAKIKVKGVHVAAIKQLIDDENSSWSSGYLYSDKYTQEEMDGLRSDYFNDVDKYLLNPLKKDKSESLSKKAADFIESKYPPHKQQMLQALLTEAVFDGKTNRVNYIKQLLSWVKSVVAFIAAIESQLETADTIKEVVSIKANFDAFEETDPQITISEALKIED